MIVPEQRFDCIASPRLEESVGLNTARLVIDTDVLIRWMDGERHSLHFHCLPSIPSARICLLLILFCKHFCAGLGGRSLLVKQSRIGVDTAAQLLSFFRQLSETAAAFRRRKLSRHSLFVIRVGYYAKP